MPCKCRCHAEVVSLRARLRGVASGPANGSRPVGRPVGWPVDGRPSAPAGEPRPARDRSAWYAAQAHARAVFEWHAPLCSAPPELPHGGPDRERSRGWYARQRAMRDHLDACLGPAWRNMPSVPNTAPAGTQRPAAPTGQRPARPAPPDTPRSYRPSSIPPVYGVPGVTGGTPPIPPQLPAQQHHHHEATADEIWADEGVRTMAARRGVNLAEQRSIFEAFLEEHPGPYTRRRVLGWIERQWPAPIGPADRRPRPVSVTVPPTAAPRRYETLPDGRPSNLTPEQWQLILERRRARGELVNA